MKDQKLAQWIGRMREVDQTLRLKTKAGKTMLNYLIYVVDGIHNYQIRKIIQEHGYPTKGLIGKKGLKDFWLLIQHQDHDLKLQEESLQRCNFEPTEKAYLTDRVLVNKGKKQIYGTQLERSKSGQLVSRPIKDRSGVDKRRKAVGLETLKEYIRRANQRIISSK